MTEAPALLWCDIESSSLDERTGFLLEVGFRVTDADLMALTEASWLIKWQPILSIKARAATEVQTMHEASGLWEECWDPKGLGFGDCLSPEAVAEICGWLVDNGAGGLPLAGSTVGFDRRWLNVWLPGFAGIPHYRSVDVSSIKVLFDLWAAEDLKAQRAELAPQRRHRVMPDIEDSVEELAFYRRVMGFSTLEVAS